MAKSIQEPFASDKIGKEYYIQSTEKPPVIDGSLDDECWSVVTPIIDFIQEEPINMDVITEKTVVYMTYDSKSLYIAARLYDSNPDLIVKQLAPHDDWYGAFDEVSDWFSIDLDSRHDHQTAFEFLVNSMGVQFDDMVFDDSYRNTEWNAVWESEVSINEGGWNVEMRIPFSFLRFSNNTEIVMGINLNRYIQRKNELMSWVVFPRGQGGVASKFGHNNSGLKVILLRILK